MSAQPTHGRGAPHAARGSLGKEAALAIKQQHERQSSLQSSRIRALPEEDGTLRASRRRRGRIGGRDGDKERGGSRAEAARAALPSRAAALRAGGRRGPASADTYSAAITYLCPRHCPGLHTPAGTSPEPAAAGKAAGLPRAGPAAPAPGRGGRGKRRRRRALRAAAARAGNRPAPGSGTGTRRGLGAVCKRMINLIFQPRCEISGVVEAVQEATWRLLRRTYTV